MLSVANYHYIRTKYSTKYPSIFGVTPISFKDQLLLLKNVGEFVSPSDLILNQDSILKSKDNYFFITFDDGLKEQYEYALPILDELNIEAIFFANSMNFENKKVSTVHKIHLLRSIISSNELIEKIAKNISLSFSDEDKQIAKSIYIYDDLDSAILKYILNFKIDFKIQSIIIKEIFDNYFDEKVVLDELYMSTQEVINLARKNLLGSHTHSHFPLGLLDKNNMIFELENSKKYFEKITNSRIDMVAYPYGNKEAVTNEVAILAEQVGYKFGFTTVRGTNNYENNPLLLNRFDCNDLIGGKNFK